MADLNVVVGEQAYESAFPRAKDLSQRDALHMRENGPLHEPAARDTHQRDDNVIFAQFVDLRDASVCHRERGMISIEVLRHKLAQLSRIRAVNWRVVYV
jgi:hypothetical protein